MNILLVEDEAGIREGLAAFLRLKGHVVRVADSCASGEQMVISEDFDLLVTDWRLGDGFGREILAHCSCPAIVMTGYPEEVADPSGRAVILCKPVSPAALLDEVERCSDDATAEPTASADHDLDDRVAQLPADTRDRIRLACALLDAADNAELLDDGAFVLLRAPLNNDDSKVLERLELLGGDLRVLELGGTPCAELRLFRDSRPDDLDALHIGDAWPPAPDPIVVDLDTHEPCSPWVFEQVVEELAEEQRRGRVVRLLNVPTHLRLYMEILGKHHLLPMRTKSGPQLPEVLAELWRDG